MKRNLLLICAFIFALFLTACKTKKPAVETVSEAVVENKCTKLSRGTAEHKDPIAEMDAKLNGDCLQMKLRYSGGCSEHYFDLYWDGTWMKSKPAVAKLILSHNSNEDMCEAIKSDMFEFDVSHCVLANLGK